MGPLRVVMTVAGSDSGAGAGIQADLKTFAALGVYGTSVITALTAQNTRRVTGVYEVPVDFIRAQMDAVLSDIGADAVKTGMLLSRAIIEAVAEEIDRRGLTQVVVDPIMVATSGDRLLNEDALEALRRCLLPLATVVTPNLPEAEALVGRAIASPAEIEEAAREIVAMGAKAVVIKGGHRTGPPVDVLYDGLEVREFSGPRIPARNTHGTGCTYSAAIAACLALGHPLPDAVGLAKAYVTEAIRGGLPLGRGAGPVDHFFSLRRDGPSAWMGPLRVAASEQPE